MPGGEDSFHLFRVKDGRSNSKADTFFVRPKQVGSEDFQPRAVYTESLDGAVTGGQRVKDLAGDNLSINGGTLSAADSAPQDGPYVTTQSESGLSGETVATDLEAVYGSPVPVGSTDLRLDTGQSIEDGSGSIRVLASSIGTRLFTESGVFGFDVRDAENGGRIFKEADGNVIRDGEGGFSAVNYNTDPTAGTLSLPNAVLDAPNGIDSSSGPVEVLSGNNLRLATGRSIEDGGGTRRFDLFQDATRIANDAGNGAVFARDGLATQFNAFANTPVRIRDQEGDFTALKYTTSSSSPGTLELANAVLDFQAGQASTTGDSMTADPESQTEDGFVEVDINGTRFQIPAYSP